MLKFKRSDPRRASVAPDQGFKSAEYELADQDVDRALQRPDLIGLRGNQMIDEEDLRRSEEKLARVITK